MKSISNLLSIIFIAFPLLNDSIIKIPPGKYHLQYDKKYVNSDYSPVFTLEYERFIMTSNDKVENLEIRWIDENSFIVKDFTESANPSAFEQEQLKSYRASFNIVREENNEYYFVLGDKKKQDTILSGKFVKIN